MPVDEEAKPQGETPLKTVRLGGGEARKAKKHGEAGKSATALPPGHVRKKSTGEIGKVQSIDPKAGTATVLWLRQGRSSTVPISSVTRR